MPPATTEIPPRHRGVVVAIMIGVALLHFVTGPGYRGPARAFVTGYLQDILLPFAVFLLLGIARIPVLNPRPVRALAVFAIGAGTEILQYFGLPLFGRTFDPLDFAMFALGIAAAALFEWASLTACSTSRRPG